MGRLGTVLGCPEPSPIVPALTGVNRVLPGMAFGILVGLIMMKVGRNPSAMVKEAFEQVKYRYVTSEEEQMELEWDDWGRFWASQNRPQSFH